MALPLRTAHQEVRTMAENDVISTLNTLIETCRDGEQGFRTAAENLEDPRVKSLFTDVARERAKFAEELKDQVERLGGRPEEGGSTAGAAHRGWMNVKAAVTGHDEKRIIAEAERGEDVAVATYRTALEQKLPPPVDSIVHRQYAHVKEAHDRVRALERERE
jgi:uncharacterized protein (TIGR02284 family)